MHNHIYLDANATSPVLPAAVAASAAAMATCFGNPSSSHAAGLRARTLLEQTRACARRVLGARRGKLMFTSGATEGIQTAVLSALVAVRERRAAGQPCGDLLLYGATEHKAVPESLAHWNRVLGAGLELRALPVDASGRHRLDVLAELAPRAAFVATMAANNETGVVSDLEGIAAVLRGAGGQALWMVDCVQALGKLPLALDDSAIDYAPFSGHKLYAPKGVGMLYVREGAPYTPLMCGGGQEAGLRSGTENMSGIAALGAVLAALEQGDTFRTHAQLAAYRERLVQALRVAFPGIEFNVPLEHALPTTINFSVPPLSSKDLLDLFDAAGVCVSAGSACSAAKAAPSYVLEAMGLPLGRSGAAVRLSFGPLADDAFVDAACERILRCGRALAADMLVPSSLCGDGTTGLLQLAAEGRCGWLLFDSPTRECVAIDPPAALAARLASLLPGHGYRLRAVLGTGADPDGVAAARHALGQAAPWPEQDEMVGLPDGRTVRAIRLGGRWLARVAHPNGASTGYLYGEVRDGVLAAAQLRYAFVGAGMPLVGLAGPRTLACGAADGAVLPCLFEESPSVAAGCADLDLVAAERLLSEYPDALLIDVRERAEHLAGGVPLRSRKALNVPLSRLAEHLPHWLQDPALPGTAQPLLFFCRSGNRSARAAATLRRLGYAHAWHLSGGVALAG